MHTCTVLLVKLPFAESSVCMHQIAYFIQRAHLHKRANGCCKNQVGGREDSDLLISANVNGGITTVSKTYIVSTTETESVNSGIRT